MNGKKNVFSIIMNGISSAFDFLYRILLEYSKIVLLVIVFIVSAQVICRKFLGFSIDWSEEVALLFMVWMAFLSLAIGVEKHIHTCVTIFYNKFPKPVQKAFTVINQIFTIIFGASLIVYGVGLVQSTSTSTLPATQWPASTLYLMVPVSGVFIIYYSLIDMFHLERFKHLKMINIDTDNAADTDIETVDNNKE